MPKDLIIVESPAKTKTLKNFLGDDYQIEASMGHVRDLPERQLGVAVDNDFAPRYEPIPERKDVLKRLSAAARSARAVYLASDPDREGEAIAWHLAEALRLEHPRRIQFNEITRSAVRSALENPRTVDMDRVNAQQARRVLDRLVGYKLSPVLWAKIQKGLSAGRVQSVAVRLICEREREILAFTPEEYWSLTAILTPQPPSEKHPFPAKLHSRGGAKLEPHSEEETTAIVQDLEGAVYSVAEVRRREQRRNAPPPFITSTLQQEASRKLGFANRRTMSVAQSLYEGIELGDQGSVGLITYMRTDSARVAVEAQNEARTFIDERYGPEFVPQTPRQFKAKGAAQDAHEAIRPTSVLREPESISKFLKPEQLKLYRLIWQRFVASQMNPAVMDVTTADINATPSAAGAAHGGGLAPYVFRATGSVMKFPGFTRVYTEGKDTDTVSDDEQPPLPALTNGQELDLLNLEPRQHFTEPPPRYTEATIVRALEELGIGRPSTYANIISTIRDRGYVVLTDKRFFPTELGFKVTDQLVKHFPDVMDVKFTAAMETRLDDVEEGKADWVELLRSFYDPFSELVRAAKEEMVSLKPQAVETEFHCPVTGNVLLQREGRYGPFLGCSAFPKCRKIVNLDPEGAPVEPLDGTFECGMREGKAGAKKEKSAGNGAAGKQRVDPATLPNATEHVCPRGIGRMLLRQSRFGPFLGCSEYPRCRTALKINPDMSLKEGQEFKCTYSEKAVSPRRKARK
ncbi:MAG TPA: type I DNA topoisomerase [Chthonomonadales bacterium]|nr:type I DNA topoisomerase [Chthonomonadales bacterium]